MKSHFDELYSQSQFLYLELLMSKKEQLLGRELHASSKVTKAKDKISNWAESAQSWKDKMDEYWWDEIGYQIIELEPQCRI